MMIRLLIKVMLGLLLQFVASLAGAHPAKSSSMLLDVGKTGIEIQLQMPVDQLQLAAPQLISVQSSGQYGVTFDPAALKSYLEQHVFIIADNQRINATVQQSQLQTLDDSLYLVAGLQFAALNKTALGQFELHSDAILHRVVTHRTYVMLHSDIYNGKLADRVTTLDVLRYQHDHTLVSRSEGSNGSAFLVMLRSGARHIAEGNDHLLFLFCLLLPAPLLARAGRWQSPATLGPSLLALTKTVTAFTLGHTLSLLLVIFGGISPPSAAVEVLVAASVAVSAVQVLKPFYRRYVVLLASVFGLVHGMAFSSQLSALGVHSDALPLALAGFNIGIELVQLFMMLLLMPILMLLARTVVYTPFRVLCALLAVLVSCHWMLQRAVQVSTGGWLAITLMILGGSALVAMLQVVNNNTEIDSCRLRGASGTCESG